MIPDPIAVSTVMLHPSGCVALPKVWSVVPNGHCGGDGDAGGGTGGGSPGPGCVGGKGGGGGGVDGEYGNSHAQRRLLFQYVVVPQASTSLDEGSQ